MPIEIKFYTNKSKKRPIIIIAVIAFVLLVCVLSLGSGLFIAPVVAGTAAGFLTPMLLQNRYRISITDKKVSFFSSTFMGSEKYEKVEQMIFSFLPTYTTEGIPVFKITADIIRSKKKPITLVWHNVSADMDETSQNKKNRNDINAIIAQLEKCEKVVVKTYPLGYNDDVTYL